MDKFVGRASEEEPPHQVTAGELLKLLQHPDCDLDKPLSVKVLQGWAEVTYASIGYTGSIHLHLWD